MGFTNDIKEQKDWAFLGDMEPALRFIFLSRPKNETKRISLRSGLKGKIRLILKLFKATIKNKILFCYRLETLSSSNFKGSIFFKNLSLFLGFIGSPLGSFSLKAST